MLFHSNEFLAFFALFFCGYVLSQGSLRFRNILLVVCSYVFYSAWDHRFAGLLLFTSSLDFVLGRCIEGSRAINARRALLAISIVINLGILATFKYFNFFQESLATLLSSFGIESQSRGWSVLLPVGISFYTFQSISYVVDVYRRQVPATGNYVQYLAYVAFFPQLVAGPIERAAHLLPQFARTLRVTIADVEAGLWLVLWGFFQKVVLADNLAPMVEVVYEHGAVSGPMLVLGTTAFALQIYCDFAGYTDIARGLARLLGFDLMLNFNLPYFARSLREFWGRWHISLSTWLRDYLYIPLGGSRQGEGRTYLNLGIVMLLGGLWHGAALSFVLWGAWHGIGLIVHHAWQRHAPQKWRLPDPAAWLLTQVFVLYGWMLFRSGSLDQIIQFSAALSDWSFPGWWPSYVQNLLVLASPLVFMQVCQWRWNKVDVVSLLPWWARAVLQGMVVLMIAAFWEREAAPFIYFQF